MMEIASVHRQSLGFFAESFSFSFILLAECRIVISSQANFSAHLRTRIDSQNLAKEIIFRELRLSIKIFEVSHPRENTIAINRD